jgi:hypothetical protein
MPEARVRLPVAAPEIQARVAQRAEHRPSKPARVGSKPIARSRFTSGCGAGRQARSVRDRNVGGSNPLTPTKRSWLATPTGRGTRLRSVVLWVRIPRQLTATKPPKHCGDAPRPYRGYFGSTPDGGSRGDHSGIAQRQSGWLLTRRWGFDSLSRSNIGSQSLHGEDAGPSNRRSEFDSRWEHRAASSPGRALARRARGQRFDPSAAHWTQTSPGGPTGEGACMVGRRSRVRLPDGARVEGHGLGPGGAPNPAARGSIPRWPVSRRHRRLGEPAGLQNPTVRFDSGRCLCLGGETEITVDS